MSLAAPALVALALAGLAAWFELRFALGKKRAEKDWRRVQVDKLLGVGSTRTLSILPLVDWYAAKDLQGEPGVSFLIKTDLNTILLDVGLNLSESDPSALQHNMNELGLSLADIDTIVISHRHIDHVGGLRWMRRRTFSLGNEQVALDGKRVFVPVPMQYPGASPFWSAAPTLIAPGVATIGTIRSQLYMGRVDEQALAIRVEGKGIVLVVGCGHQSMPKLLARAKELFDDPIYGVIGGLHYPLPRGRWTQVGLDLQRLLVYGPLRRPRVHDVQSDIALLEKHRPAWVSLSAHDSSDEMIEEFRGTFGSRYHDLCVGEWQNVAAAPVWASSRVVPFAPRARREATRPRRPGIRRAR